ncbi:MAG: hypothetical protein WBB85_02805 [Albidovulum sp.]|uniref:hypothetical protein n=1 Tax=Albidovulum sp. TaxID=1872424 RepID=UPI003CA1587A
MAHSGRILGLGALALFLALPADAGGKFAAPQGCEVYATVQMRDCQVSHHYRCTADAPGDQWAVYLDGDGPFYMSRIDSETRWMQSHDLISGENDRLADEVDPASFTTLITTGRDDFDFHTTNDAGEEHRHSGNDILTGETVVIDGVRLERTKFDLTTRDRDGNVLWSRKGQQLVHRGWRIFFADREHFENSFGDEADVINTPVDFAFPGDKGFLTTEPIYDCDMMMTELRP